MIVGIDLGTTFSLIGRMFDGKPELVPNPVGGYLFPSSIHIDASGTVLVGSAARSRAVLNPERSAIHFKRDMGTNHLTSVGSRSFRAEELSSLVLRSLKEHAEAYWGTSVVKAVISVPAYFGEHQRQATRSAAEIAGIEVVRLINEPTAAAIAYGFDQRDKEHKVAILDLGGGTFDVTLLELIEGVIEVKSSAGDLFLGGIDFDKALAEVIKQEARTIDHELPQDSVTTARLMEMAEQTKKVLSSQEIAYVVLRDIKTVSGARQDISLVVTREQAEAAWVNLTDRLRRPVFQALSDASWRPADIDDVILVGGSTRMPLVYRIFGDLFGKTPLRDLPSDEAVAIGAVLCAGLIERDVAIEDLVVTDIAPFTMGTKVIHIEGNEHVDDVYLPIIERGTVIPCSRTQLVQPVSRTFPFMKIEIYQGEHPACSKNTRLGELKLSGIPASNRDVEIRYTYDLNGILEVEATVLGTGKQFVKLIHRGGALLSQEAVARAVKEMQKLKIHPAEEVVNQTVLARAELAYANSIGDFRKMIGVGITDFRIALESYDKNRIEAARLRLHEMMQYDDE